MPACFFFPVVHTEFVRLLRKHHPLLAFRPRQKVRLPDDLKDKLSGMFGSETLVFLFVLPLGAIGTVCDGFDHNPAHMMALREIREGGRLHLTTNGFRGQVLQPISRLWMIDQERP